MCMVDSVVVVLMINNLFVSIEKLIIIGVLMGGIEVICEVLMLLLLDVLVVLIV